MYVTKQSLIQAASDLNAGRDAILQGDGPDTGHSYTIHKSTQNTGVGTDTEMTTGTIGIDGLATFAHNINGAWPDGDPRQYTEVVNVVSGDLKFTMTFQLWKPGKPLVTDPVHSALIFILDHLSNTASGPNGTESFVAAKLKADLMDKLYPVDKPVANPVDKPVANPVDKPVANPVDTAHRDATPAVKPPAGPVVQPIVPPSPQARP